MRTTLRGTAIRLTIFVAVCSLGLFALTAVFAQLRFQDEVKYLAIFANVSGLKTGDFVRIAGVEVGKVKDITIRDDATVLVEFSADESVVLTEGTLARVIYENLVGDRFLALEEGTGGVRRVQPGATIPLSNTAPALDLDSLIGGFRPLFRALDPEKVNALTSELVHAFQGQGATIDSFLAQTATLTSSLADRDQLIGEVITNLNVVMGSLARQSNQFDKAVDSLSELVKALADRRTDISTSVAYTDATAASVTDLLSLARPPLQKVVKETDRLSGNIIADQEYFDTILKSLPDKYQLLSRFGLYGDFFSFYICDVFLKVNGKGGQPVYMKVVAQSTGRCEPR